MVGGVPVGTYGFIQDTMEEKTDETVAVLESTSGWLDNDPQALWAVLRHCGASRLDYWLGHLAPAHTEEFAMQIDDALVRAFGNITYEGALDDNISRRRYHLPARLRGCGMRSRKDLAPIAHVASFVEAATKMLNITTLDARCVLYPVYLELGKKHCVSSVSRILHPETHTPYSVSDTLPYTHTMLYRTQPSDLM